mgnify:CR=1 FL=1
MSPRERTPTAPAAPPKKTAEEAAKEADLRKVEPWAELFEGTPGWRDAYRKLSR